MMRKILYIIKELNTIEKKQINITIARTFDK